MRKGLILSLILVSAVEVLPGMVFAGSDGETCIDQVVTGEYESAIRSGTRALRANARNVEAHVCLGAAFTRSGNFEEGMRHLKAAETYATEPGDLSAIATLLSECYYGMGDQEGAIAQVERALFLDRQLEDAASIGKDLTRLASLYLSVDERDRARELLEESIQYEASEDEMADRYGTLAVLYGDIADKKCLTYSGKAMKLQERAGDLHGLTISHLNLGDQYRKLEMYKEAAEELQTGYVAIRLIGDRLWEGVALKYMGWLFKQLGEVEEAQQALEASLAIFLELGDTRQLEDVKSSLDELRREKKRQLQVTL